MCIAEVGHLKGSSVSVTAEVQMHAQHAPVPLPLAQLQTGIKAPEQEGLTTCLPIECPELLIPALDALQGTLTKLLPIWTPPAPADTV